MSTGQLKINILVFDNAKDLDEQEAEQDLVVDIHGHAGRTWLSSFVAWATHANKAIEITPERVREVNFTPKNKDH